MELLLPLFSLHSIHLSTASYLAGFIERYIIETKCNCFASSLELTIPTNQMYLAGIFTILMLFFSNSVYCYKSVQDNFNQSKIVPDILKFAPDKKVEVSYDSGKTVSMGNNLTPTEVRKQPVVNYNGNPNKFYTLLMVDPDAPSAKEPRAREWQHWLVVNIPGNELAAGEILTEYVGSGPPKNSGYHRYVFVVYEQKDKLTFNESIRKNDNGKRGKFKTEAFATKYQLGNPFAGNFFKAQFDDSVPSLHKQLGF